jgi:hypothetical protein
VLTGGQDATTLALRLEHIVQLLIYWNVHARVLSTIKKYCILYASYYHLFVSIEDAPSYMETRRIKPILRIYRAVTCKSNSSGRTHDTPKAVLSIIIESHLHMVIGPKTGAEVDRDYRDVPPIWKRIFRGGACHKANLRTSMRERHEEKKRTYLHTSFNPGSLEF